MSGFDLAALERRIAALEANRGASLRFGTVTEVNATDGSARVELPDGGGMVSWPLRVLSRRSLKDKAQCLPDLGEPVACLFAGQGMEAGVLLGACYSTQTPAPGQTATHDYMIYEDGTEIWYDRESHKLMAKVKGDAEIETEGQIHAKAQKEIRAESATTITLKAPIIHLKGLLRATDKDGKPGSGELLGNYRIRDGKLDVPDGDIATGQKLVATADAVINGVSFVQHGHEGVMPGAGVSGVPVGGGGGSGGGPSSDPNNTDRYEEDFNALYTESPESTSTKDKLLLCLPEIAQEEAEKCGPDKDAQGWFNLRVMFLKWFSGTSNTDAEASPEVFWIDIDWVLSYMLARNEYDKFVTPETMLSPAARDVLAKILYRNGYLTDKRISFDFTNPPLVPTAGTRPWRIWKDDYFHNWPVSYPLVDGIMACLGRFSYRALAAGYTEPLPEGGHSISVERISVFLWDAFDFTGEDDLGYWNCKSKAYSLLPLPGYSHVYNSDLQNFRNKYGMGHDFMVLSKPKSVAGFARISYVTPL